MIDISSYRVEVVSKFISHSVNLYKEMGKSY